MVNTLATESAFRPRSWTNFSSGFTSSLENLSRVSWTLGKLVHVSRIAAPNVLAADDRNWHGGLGGTRGGGGASMSPYANVRTKSVRHISMRVRPAASTVVPSVDSVI